MALSCEPKAGAAPVDQVRPLSMADWSHRRRRTQKRALRRSKGVTSTLEYSRAPNVDQFWVTATTVVPPPVLVEVPDPGK